MEAGNGAVHSESRMPDTRLNAWRRPYPPSTAIKGCCMHNRSAMLPATGGRQTVQAFLCRSSERQMSCLHRHRGIIDHSASASGVAFASNGLGLNHFCTVTKRSGTSIIPITVAAIMPPITPIPMAFCDPDPAPWATASGVTPRMTSPQLVFRPRIRQSGWRSWRQDRLWSTARP